MIKAGVALSFAGFVVAAGLALAVECEAADGKTLFVEKKCNLCHSIDSQGIAKKSARMKGAELSDAGNRLESVDWLKRFLVREVDKDGKNHQKKWSGTDEELEAIATWVMSLKK
jgi:mono/diheme cytochrome c family protein